MKFITVDDGYLLRLEPGEEVVEVLTSFAEDNKINSGFISGIGAAGKIRCGYFDPQVMQYFSKNFDGDLEILSLSGNISRLEGKAFPHIHIMLCNEEQKVYGGHLFEAVISVTCEIHLNVLKRNLNRFKDPETGFTVLDI